MNTIATSFFVFYSCHFFFVVLYFKLRTYISFVSFFYGFWQQARNYTRTFLYIFFLFWQPANHGARPNVAKYVIVLTDGRSNDNSKTVQAAMALHNVPNVTVIAIGIGHAIDVNELHIIATDRNHSFVVNNFDLLHTLEVELVDKTCTRELSPFD